MWTHAINLYSPLIRNWVNTWCQLIPCFVTCWNKTPAAIVCLIIRDAVWRYIGDNDWMRYILCISIPISIRLIKFKSKMGTPFKVIISIVLNRCARNRCQRFIHSIQARTVHAVILFKNIIRKTHTLCCSIICVSYAVSGGTFGWVVASFPAFKV